MSIKSVFGVELPEPSQSQKSEEISAATTPVVTPTPTPVKKPLRRNKFKSGFDYMRKKKKVVNHLAADGSVIPPPPKRVKVRFTFWVKTGVILTFPILGRLLINRTCA